MTPIAWNGKLDAVLNGRQRRRDCGAMPDPDLARRLRVALGVTVYA